MDGIKHTPHDEMMEFELEWHHLLNARTALEWIAVAAIVAGVVYSIWPYVMR